MFSHNHDTIFKFFDCQNRLKNLRDVILKRLFYRQFDDGLTLLMM